MSDKSAIEWTDATWNPTTGCTRVSPGCDHCYIERTPPFRTQHRAFDKPGVGGSTGVQLHPDRLDQPLRWQRPRRVFVNSLSDLFHDDVPDDFIADVFAVMAVAEKHVFQVLTKRPRRMRDLTNSMEFAGRIIRSLSRLAGVHHSLLPSRPWPLPNVWLGTSVEDQKRAKLRIPQLLETPAAVRFLSCEPLLGPVDLTLRWGGNEERDEDGNLYWGALPALTASGGRIDWVIAGGESGPDARPMHPDWVRSLRDQCVAAGVPFFFKQWGEWVTEDQSPQDAVLPGTAKLPFATYSDEDDALSGDQTAVYRLGKKKAGRELDGRTWDEMPEVVPA